MIGTAQVKCPVDGCTWRLVLDPPQTSRRYLVRTDQPFAQALDEAITEAANRDAKATEDAIRAHLGTHDVFDFVRTIHRLTFLVGEAG